MSKSTEPPHIPMSWVALWVWGHRENNPANEYFNPETGECVKSFVMVPDEFFPWCPPARNVFLTDTVVVRLEGKPWEVEGVRRLAMASLDNPPRLV